MDATWNILSFYVFPACIKGINLTVYNYLMNSSPLELNFWSTCSCSAYTACQERNGFLWPCSRWFPLNLALSAENMRSARRAAFSQWSSCPGFGIPTWQRLWSVFLSQTWNGFKSRAAALNLQRAVHLHTHRIDGALTPDVALSPPQVSIRAVHRWCWQF